MADEDTEVAVEGEASSKKSGGLIKKLMLGVGALALMAVGVFAGPMIMNMISGSGDDGAVDADGEEVAVADSAPADGPALYQSLLPPLVVNIKDQYGEAHFMQLSMEAMAREQNVVNTIREHTPVIRNNLILLYGNATYESVTTREGKEKLLQDGLAEIQSIIDPYVGDGRVEALYFTALIVQ